MRRAAQGQKTAQGTKSLAPPSLRFAPNPQEYTHSFLQQLLSDLESNRDRVSWGFCDFPTLQPADPMPSPCMGGSVVHKGILTPNPWTKTLIQPGHRVNSRPLSKAHLTSHTHSQAQSFWLGLRTRRSVSGRPRGRMSILSLDGIHAKGFCGVGLCITGLQQCAQLLPTGCSQELLFHFSYHGQSAWQTAHIP